MTLQKLIDMAIADTRDNSHDADALIVSLRVASALADARVGALVDGDGDIEWDNFEDFEAWWFHVSTHNCTDDLYKEVLRDVKGWWEWLRKAMTTTTAEGSQRTIFPR